MERALIGAGGFAREIKHHMGNPHMKMFVDDVYYKKNNENIYPLSKFDKTKYEIIIAIGNPLDRFNMVSKLPKKTKYFTFIHKSAQILDNGINIGDGWLPLVDKLCSMIKYKLNTIIKYNDIWLDNKVIDELKHSTNKKKYTSNKKGLSN